MASTNNNSVSNNINYQGGAGMNRSRTKGWPEKKLTGKGAVLVEETRDDLHGDIHGSG
jgi:hypothetical protein